MRKQKENPMLDQLFLTETVGTNLDLILDFPSLWQRFTYLEGKLNMHTFGHSLSCRRLSFFHPLSYIFTSQIFHVRVNWVTGRTTPPVEILV